MKYWELIGECEMGCGAQIRLYKRIAEGALNPNALSVEIWSPGFAQINLKCSTKPEWADWSQSVGIPRFDNDHSGHLVMYVNNKQDLVGVLEGAAALIRRHL